MWGKAAEANDDPSFDPETADDDDDDDYVDNDCSEETSEEEADDKEEVSGPRDAKRFEGDAWRLTEGRGRTCKVRQRPHRPFSLPPGVYRNERARFASDAASCGLTLRCRRTACSRATSCCATSAASAASGFFSMGLRICHTVSPRSGRVK